MQEDTVPEDSENPAGFLVNDCRQALHQEGSETGKLCEIHGFFHTRR